ncbi:MAG: type II toxin-antitoxin system HicB family antitoxin [Solirubrobacteraceae bacterium]
MELTVVVHHESDGFWSEIAELPGCFASGATPDELHEAVGEAVGLYLWDVPAALNTETLGLGETPVTVRLPESRG